MCWSVTLKKLTKEIKTIRVIALKQITGGQWNNFIHNAKKKQVLLMHIDCPLGFFSPLFIVKCL